MKNTGFSQEKKKPLTDHLRTVSRTVNAFSGGLLAIFVGLSAGCAAGSGGAQIVDVDSKVPLRHTGMSAQDLRTVTSRMARSLIRLPQIAGATHPPRVAFLDIRNRTNQIINKNIFLNRIRTQLIKHSGGRILFLDRERIKDILKERRLKRVGEVTVSHKKDLSGADFFLTGELNSIDKQEGAARVTYIRYSFRLTDTETSIIIWEDDYEIKKVGRRSLWDR